MCLTRIKTTVACAIVFTLIIYEEMVWQYQYLVFSVHIQFC